MVQRRQIYLLCGILGSLVLQAKAQAEGCPGPCEQICYEVNGEAVCSCRGGFQLQPDMYSCQDIDECASGTSGCTQGCSNTEGSFQCFCFPGYEAHPLLPFLCSDINECTDSNGGCQDTCTNSDGSFECSCTPPATLLPDGFSCDVDECTSNNGGCSDICVNTIGSFHCDCSTGYELDADGVTCIDIDECLTANGGCDQICVNEPGSFSCECEEGFQLTLDGKTCTMVVAGVIAHFRYCKKYTIVDECKRYGRARIECQDTYHGELAIVTDPKVNRLLVRSLRVREKTGNLQCGGIWFNGKKTLRTSCYSNWAGGSSSGSSSSMGSVESFHDLQNIDTDPRICVQFWSKRKPFWTLSECADEKGFICQYEEVVEIGP